MASSGKKILNLLHEFVCSFETNVLCLEIDDFFMFYSIFLVFRSRMDGVIGCSFMAGVKCKPHMK